MKYLVSLFYFFLITVGMIRAQGTIDTDSLWADSVMKKMTPDERISQLFMVNVSSNWDQHYFDSISKQIKEYKVGGVVFFKGSPVKQAMMTNRLQMNSDVPLMIAMDAEWGLGMRLDSTISFPRQLTLGAVQNNNLIFRMGSEIARECKRIGITMNFAPVADLNSNPKNPVINSRSFGENKYSVAKKALTYMKGMQSEGILTCAKHFPGHGDTETDSHFTLPVIHHTQQMIDTLDLYPFKILIQNDVSSVMVAHLNIPSLDTSKNSVSSLSKVIVTDLLKDKLGFKGLVITDALEMKGVSETHQNGEAELQALLAGNDILLMPHDIPVAIEKIINAIDSSVISQDEIDKHCKKILQYKHAAGLQNFKPIEIKGLEEDLNAPDALYLQRELFEDAITLVKNDNDIIPFKRPDTLMLASVSIGDSIIRPFQNRLSCYAFVDHYFLKNNLDRSETDSILKILKKYDYVIAAFINTNNLANEEFGITQQAIDFIDTLKEQNRVILDVFANPYTLSRFSDTHGMEAIIVSYQNSMIPQDLSAQLIFGGISCSGKLPVTASSFFPVNTGIVSDKPFRLMYTLPEDDGIRVKDLERIDSIALKGIQNKAYPGCVILVAKDGKVIYNKAFGYHTYENLIPEKTSDIFDMASITKIGASTMAIMKLVDEGKLDINKHLEDYLPILKGSNKAHIVIRDLLAHQAKLKAWIPFYKETIVNGKPDTNIYHKVPSDEFPFRVADSLYIRKDYPDTIIQKIIDSPLNKKKEYLYSDMGFYLMMKIVEKISGKSFDSFVKENFYVPLGMSSTAFQPRKYFSLDRIVPTEIDTSWRKQIVFGDVNDQGAAMMGGICGHAGLFSNASDLAAMMQMMLQKGEYAGIRFFDSTTVTEFTKYQFPDNKNRRGLGFDKPALKPKEAGPCSSSASASSYGHSGFTGTFFWVDPQENLIYIFLSNRVYPDPNNKKLTEMGIRTDIQQVIYDAIANSKLQKN